MRALSAREKRTIWIAAILAAGYLAIFYGSMGIRILEKKKAEYEGRLLAVEELRLAALQEATKGMRLRKLQDELRIRPGDLKEETVVGEASAAIQRAAGTSGIQIGPTKETRSGGSSRELATIAIEGQGSVDGAIRFIHGLREIGFPIVVDAVGMKALPKNPGQVSLSMTLVVLNYSAWKATEKSDA